MSENDLRENTKHNVLVEDGKYLWDRTCFLYSGLFTLLDGSQCGTAVIKTKKHGQRWQLVKYADVLETQEKLRTFKQTRNTNEIHHEIQTDPG